MDLLGHNTDAFVELSLGEATVRSELYQHNRNFHKRGDEAQCNDTCRSFRYNYVHEMLLCMVQILIKN